MNLIVRTFTLPLRRAFAISHGTLDAVEVVRVRLTQDGISGYGEARPYARYGEDVSRVSKQIMEKAGLPGHDNPADTLSPGAAKAALDAAWRDWQARADGQRAAASFGLDRPVSCPTAQTIVIGPPEDMQRAARTMAHCPLLKVKLDRHQAEDRIRAVRAGAPDAEIIVDANEAWTADMLQSLSPVLEEARVGLLEQPLPAADDKALRGLDLPIPVCADESCHSAKDIDRLKGLYDVVNIKLDKAGGLGMAFDLAVAARTAGLKIMLGCMVSSSLAIAPASLLAGLADYIDLDGPDWLARDISGGFQFRNGLIRMAAVDFWGEGKAPSPDVEEAFA